MNKRTDSNVAFARSLLAVGLIALLTMLAGCENAVATKRGAVSGLVTDLQNNAIAGAMITSHRSLFKAETDENGHYDFTSLDVGTHRFTVARNGYYLASRTVEIGYGEVVDGINIKVEALERMISYSLVVREATRVVIDVTCKEAMSVQIGWREKTGARIQLPPTAVLAQHQITLTGLFHGSQYLFDLEGVTADGRRFTAEPGSFKTVPYADMPGAPDPVTNFNVVQGSTGPVLTWQYAGADPVTGFRLFRGQNDSDLTLYQDENTIFAAQDKVIDEYAVPGRIYRYAMQSVDLDGNVSSYSASVSIMPGGKITEDLVWKKAWSPITVNGDLIIPAERTLRIEAGCTVRFASVDNGRTGYSPAICEFIVEGTLLAEGSELEPVKLISASSLPTRTDWDGIRLISTKDQPESILKNVVISGAEDGLALYDASATIASLTARFCRTGLSVHGASGTALIDLNFEDCETGFSAENTWFCSAENLVVKNCNTGILLAGNSNFLLSHFDVRDTREVSLKVVDRRLPRLRNGLLQSSRAGMTIGAASGDFQYLTVDAPSGILVDGADVPIIKNCIIVNRQSPATGYGIEDKTLSRSYPHNNISGYAQPTFNCDQAGAPVINIEPLFVGGSGDNYDYHLRADSPVVAASDAGGQPGAYGSEN